MSAPLRSRYDYVRFELLLFLLCLVIDLLGRVA